MAKLDYIRMILKSYEIPLKRKMINLKDISYKYQLDYTYLKRIKIMMCKRGELDVPYSAQKQGKKRIEIVDKIKNELLKVKEMKRGILTELAEKFGISRERVRQIKEDLIDEGKLRRYNV